MGRPEGLQHQPRQTEGTIIDHPPPHGQTSGAIVPGLPRDRRRAIGSWLLAIGTVLVIAACVAVLTDVGARSTKPAAPTTTEPFRPFRAVPPPSP